MKRSADDRRAQTQEELEQKRRIMKNFCSWTIDSNTRVAPDTIIECDRVLAVTVKMSDYEPHALSFGQVTHTDEGSAICNRAVMMAFVHLVAWIVRKKAVGNSAARNREARRTIGGDHAQAYLLGDGDVNLRDFQDDEAEEGGMLEESEDEALHDNDEYRSESDGEYRNPSGSDIEIHELDSDSDHESVGGDSDESEMSRRPMSRRKQRQSQEDAPSPAAGRELNLSLSQIGAPDTSRISGENVIILIEEIPAENKKASVEGSLSELRSITDNSIPVAYTIWALLNDVDDVHPEQIWNSNMLMENMRDLDNLSTNEIKHMLNMGVDVDKMREEEEQAAEEEQPKKSKKVSYQLAQKKSDGKRDVADAWKIITSSNAPYIWDNYCGHNLGAQSRLGAPFLPGVIDPNDCQYWTTFFHPFFALRRRGADCNHLQSLETYWTGNQAMYAPNDVNKKSTKSTFVVPASINSRFFRVMDPAQLNTMRMKNMYFPHKQREVHILSRIYPGHFDVSSKRNSERMAEAHKFFGPTVDQPAVAGRIYTEAELGLLYKMVMNFTTAQAEEQLNAEQSDDMMNSGWKGALLKSSSNFNGPSGRSLLIPLENTSTSSLGGDLNPTKEQWIMLADDNIRSEIIERYHVMDEQIQARKAWQKKNLLAMAAINPSIVSGREAYVNIRSDPREISLHVNPVGSQKELFSTNFDSLFKAMRVIEIAQFHKHIKDIAFNLATTTKRATQSDMAKLRMVCSLQACMDYAGECTSGESDISDGARIIQNCKKQMQLYTDVKSRPMFYMMDPTASPLVNVMSVMFNNYYSRLHLVKPNLMFLLYMTSLIGSKLEKVLRMHMLIIGPPGEGKTFLSDYLQHLLCSYKTKYDEVFRVEETIRKSEHSTGTNIGGKKNFMVQLCQEADQGQLNGNNKDNNQQSEGSSTYKNLLDKGYSRVERPLRDPDTGEWLTQVSEAYYFCPHIFNANFNSIGMSAAILDRFMRYYNVRSNVSKLWVDVADEKDKDKRMIDPAMMADVCWQHKFIDACIFEMHMLIKMGGMDPVTVWLATLVIQEVNRALSRANLPKIRPRDALRITDMACGLVMLDAVTSECLMPGGIFTKKPITLEKELRQLNPRLYVAPRHIVTAMWMVTDNCYMPALADIRRALKLWYNQNKQQASMESFRLFKGGVKKARMPGVDETDAEVRSYDEIILSAGGRGVQFNLFTGIGEYLNIMAQASSMGSVNSDTADRIEYQWSASIFAEGLEALTKCTYVAKRYHKPADTSPMTDPVPNNDLPTFICSPIKAYKNSIGVNTCWLFNDQAMPGPVIRSAMKNLFSKRHQPEERHIVGIDPVYNNTFIFDTYGHEDCDDPHLEVYKRVNPHFEQEIDLDVEYGEWYEQVKACNGTKMQNVDMPLESIACAIRAAEIHFDKNPITERDIGEFIYNQAPRVLSEDTKSPYYGKTIPAEMLKDLDKKVDLSIPRDRYLVPDEDGQMVPHWDVLFKDSGMNAAERERVYFEGMNHTIGYVVADRIIRNSAKFSKTGLPLMFQLRFMDTTLSNSESNFSDVIKNRQLGIYMNLSREALDRREKRMREGLAHALKASSNIKRTYKPIRKEDILIQPVAQVSGMRSALPEAMVPGEVMNAMEDMDSPDREISEQSVQKGDGMAVRQQDMAGVDVENIPTAYVDIDSLL